MRGPIMGGGGVGSGETDFKCTLDRGYLIQTSCMPYKEDMIQALHESHMSNFKFYGIV